MNYRHGKAHSPIYNVWSGIYARCTNPNSPAYPNYGGRGITLCERWRDFANFYADMGDAAPGMTVERIDNDQGYSPENCRWATRTEQGRNKRNNRLLTVDGETLPVSAWAERTGIEFRTIHARLKKGWSDDQAVKTPLVTDRTGMRTRPPALISLGGETMTILEWADRLGVAKTAVAARLRKWPIERALTTPRCNTGRINARHDVKLAATEADPNVDAPAAEGVGA